MCIEYHGIYGNSFLSMLTDQVLILPGKICGEFPKWSREVSTCEGDVKEYIEVRELHLECPVQGEEE